jgi:hypothetical protein
VLRHRGLTHDRTGGSTNRPVTGTNFKPRGLESRVPAELKRDLDSAFRRIQILVKAALCEDWFCFSFSPPTCGFANTYLHSSDLLRSFHFLFRFYAGARLDPSVKMISRRKHDGTSHGFVDPSVQLNAGLWTLFAGATVFLGLRLYIKITRRHGLWWDDHILIVSWVSPTCALHRK